MAGVKPIPDGYPQVIPSLAIDGAGAALDFYCAVFDASVRLRMDTPDGKVGHAELQLGDSVIMLADEFPDIDFRGPKSVGGTPITLGCTYRTSTRSSPGPWPPAPNNSGRWKTSSTATGRDSSRTRSATVGASPRTSRTCRPTR